MLSITVISNFRRNEEKENFRTIQFTKPEKIYFHVETPKDYFLKHFSLLKELSEEIKLNDFDKESKKFFVSRNLYLQMKFLEEFTIYTTFLNNH